MSERYSKLFALSENLYSVGAPVVIAAGALQKDNQTGKVFAQLKIRNIQDKSIKATTVKITPFDTVGKPLGGTVDYQYLDLSAERDTDFGQKTPVILKEAATRSFSVSVLEVVFSDDSVWTTSNEAWEPLSPPVALETALSDNELAKQYQVKYGADCKCIFKREKDLWRCACGAINHNSEKNCHSCQRGAAALAALNMDELKADRDKRLAAEQKKAAEAKALEQKRIAVAKAAAAEQAKKTKKIAMIAAPIVIVAIVAAVLISNFVKAQQEEAARLDAYNAAVALAEAGQYEEAIAAFTELGDYKDSATLAAQAQEEAEEAARLEAYNAAVALAEAGQYEEAIAAFEELGDYKDSTELISSAKLEKKYIEALTLLENRDFEAARATFEALGDYKDAKTYLDGFVIRLTSWTYDGKESGEYQYNESGDVIKSGNWTYVYSADKRTKTGSAGSTSITETYDEQGYLAQRSENSYAGSATSTFTYEFNSDGTVSTRIEKRTEHNGLITHERDCVVSYEYGDNGLVSKETETETSAYNLREGKGPNSITVRKYYYDDNGQMLSRKDTITSYNLTTGEARESNHRYEYTSGWVYAPNAEK